MSKEAAILLSESTLPSEDYVLFADRSKSLSGLNKRMLFIVLPLVLLSFVFYGYFAHGFLIPIHVNNSPHPVRHIRVQFDPAISFFFSWFPWFLLAECVLLYSLAARSYRKQAKPILTLSSEGIGVDTMGTHLGLIYWDEIEEVRNYTLIYRNVGIVPKNTAALRQRLGMKRTQLLRLNAGVIPLYKLLGIFVAPINIPQVHLPITADELLARIQLYQAAYSHRTNRLPPSTGSSDIEGVWPPAPRNEGPHSQS